MDEFADKIQNELEGRGTDVVSDGESAAAAGTALKPADVEAFLGDYSTRRGFFAKVRGAHKNGLQRTEDGQEDVVSEVAFEIGKSDAVLSSGEKMRLDRQASAGGRRYTMHWRRRNGSLVVELRAEDESGGAGQVLKGETKPWGLVYHGVVGRNGIVWEEDGDTWTRRKSETGDG